MQHIRVGPAGDRNAGIWGGDIRITPDVLIGDRVMPGERAIVAPEPITPIIASATLLGDPGGGLESAGFGLHAKIAAPDINLDGSSASGGRRGAVDDAAEQAVGAINPIVQAKAEAVYT